MRVLIHPCFPYTIQNGYQAPMMNGVASDWAAVDGAVSDSAEWS